MEPIELALIWLFLMGIGWISKNPFIAILASILGLYLGIEQLNVDFIVGLVIFAISLITIFDVSKEL